MSDAGARIHQVGAPAATKELVAAGFGTCAKRRDGWWCWGTPAMGVGGSTVPTRLPHDDVTALALGGTHYCILDSKRHVSCVGRNYDGELGDGTTSNALHPRPVVGLSDVVAIAAASFKTCALVDAREGKRHVYCWGTDEGSGKQGEPARRSEPFRVGDIDDARELALDWGLACVRRSDGSAWCWGNDDYGQLGRGEPPFGTRRPKPTRAPVRVLYVDDAAGIAAGGFRACVLSGRGTVGCWGDNGYGALGDGTTRSHAYPSDVVGLTDVAEIGVGGFGHACARRRDGTVWCWGHGIGESGARSRKRPVQVTGLGEVVEIAAGHTHTCARRSDRSIACWGENSEHQLGDGTSTPTTTPRQVLGPE